MEVTGIAVKRDRMLVKQVNQLMPGKVFANGQLSSAADRSR